MAEHLLETTGATIAYDVYPASEQPANPHTDLFMIGQPMLAADFRTLASYFKDRTVITYDPRGLGRSRRHDGRDDHNPTLQAEDLHALINNHGGPVDLFASSGGAVTALALVARHPDDVKTLVAHEPPLVSVLPDSEHARRAIAAIHDIYQQRGWSAAMAAFITMTSWSGPFTQDYVSQAPPDPERFGFTMADDGSRDDPLLSDRSSAINDYRPDIDALISAPTRILLAYGRESHNLFTARAAEATAKLLGQEPVVFPSHHGGFTGPETGYPGQPEAFAEVLRTVLGPHSRPGPGVATAGSPSATDDRGE